MNSFDFLSFRARQSFVILCLIAGAVLLSSCGNSDAEFQIKKFCSQVKTGESIMEVVSRAGKVEFDKYWLEKIDKKPPGGKSSELSSQETLRKKPRNLKN